MTKLAPPQKQNNYKLLAVAIAAAISTNTTFAAEAETEEHRDLNMIEIKGQATSGIDTLITTEDLEKTSANDLSDIFKLDPQINASGTVPMSQKIYLRNIGEDGLNISVDGAEQSGSVFHHTGRVAVEPDLLKQVEVEAGAGSAATGFGALGGSVRFVTKDPSDLLEPGETAGALIKGTYYSNTEGYKSSTSVFSRDETDTVSVLASFVRSEHDSAEDGNGDEIKGTEIGQRMSYAKFVANLSDEQKLSVSYEKLKEEGDILYKPELLHGPKNLAEATEAQRDTAILNYFYDSNSNELIDLHFNLYKTESEQNRKSAKFSAIAGFPVIFDGAIESYGFTLQNTSQFADHKLIYGVNYRDDESYLNDLDTTTGQFGRSEETGEVKGLFVQDIFEVTNDLTLSAGLRFDDYELKDHQDQTLEDDRVSPNFSANYDVTDYLSFSAGYAEAFRGPEVSDSFKITESFNDEDLKGQTAKNMELGMDLALGDFTLAAGVYKTKIEDAIARQYPWAKQVVNFEDDIETDGYYLKAGYVWDALTASVSYHSADTDIGSQTAIRYLDSSMATSIGDTVITDVSYEFTQDFLLGWTAEFVEGIDDIKVSSDRLQGEEIADVKKSGYGVHDIYARWLPTSDEDFSLTLTVKNLFDKQYLDQSSVENLTENKGYESISGSPEAGRDFRLTAALRI